jgi:acetyl-CoA acetyltransferase
MASFVIDAVRTPRGRGKAGKGALSSVHPQEMFATVLRALVERGTVPAAKRASKAETSRATPSSRRAGPSK